MKHKRRSVLCGLLAMIVAAGMGGLTSDSVSAKDSGVSGAFYTGSGDGARGQI